MDINSTMYELWAKGYLSDAICWALLVFIVLYCGNEIRKMDK